MGEIWHLYHSEVHVTPKPRTIIFNVIIIIRVLSCDCRIPYTCTCCCFFLLLTRQGSSTQKYMGKYVSKFSKNYNATCTICDISITMQFLYLHIKAMCSTISILIIVFYLWYPEVSLIRLVSWCILELIL